MEDDAFETLLRAWGRYYGERAESADTGLSEPGMTTTHPLARALEFAPGKRKRVLAERIDARAGFDRRRMMAAAVGIKGMRILPAHFVDPIRCTETRAPVFGLGELSRPVPPELQRVQRAALDLLALHRLRGLCIRIQYCARGPQDEKSDRVAEMFGEPVGLRRYREALAEGRGFMLGRLTP